MSWLKDLFGDPHDPVFSNTPDLERLNKLIKAADEFFNQIKGVQGDEIISYNFGKLEFILWGSENARDQEYYRRHKAKMPGYSICWVGAGKDDRSMKVEVYAPFKRLKNGNVIIHPWVLQHEAHHAIDEALRLSGHPGKVTSPDDMVKPKFWE